MHKWLNGYFYDIMRLISMKKHGILHELKNKTETELTSHKLYKSVDRLGLPNDLVDRLIGGTMSFAIVWISRSNRSTVMDPVKVVITSWPIGCDNMNRSTIITDSELLLFNSKPIVL